MASSLRSCVAAAGALIAAGLAPYHGAAAQQPSAAPADAGRRVVGHVVRPAPRGTQPVAGIWVTLHRVGSDSAGPLDSLRAGADGRFAFDYRRTGREDAVYFVSASYGGIAYFAEPLRAEVAEAEADITVFDTTSAPVPLKVRGRHVIVSAASASGRRTVTEVYELSNDTTVTAVAPAAGATFTAVLPDGAADPQVGSGDVAGEAVAFDGGRVSVTAPFAPGLKQLAYAYTLPAEAFPLRVPVLRGAEVLEVLVEEPTAQVSGAGLAATDSATVSGRTFRRFLAQDVKPSAVAQIGVPPAPAFGRRGYLAALAALIGGAMLVALLRALAFRRRTAPAAAAAPALADRIVHEIAALDRGFEQRTAPSDADRASYAARRAELKAQLTAALGGSSARA